ncbi:MAG TPA: energy transducer TonB [Thermoanaerobaculia bacterium]|nr:energy transducer TonB [Thermoanaerobaculia bacterium]
MIRAARTAVLLFAVAALAAGQTTPAEVQEYQEAVYPEALLKGQQQGNVLLIGRIDREGRVQDLRMIAASYQGFIDPALAAVRAWQFKPATRDGKPVEIAANVGVRFRLKSDRRGMIPQPILGDLPVYPADASGKRAAPEGFPIRLGVDPKVRAEAVLDVEPQSKARSIRVRVEATSPAGRPYILFESPISVPARATEVRVPVVASVGSDWPEGVWILRFLADGKDAGGGQFWLARDPSRFDFGAALRR